MEINKSIVMSEFKCGTLHSGSGQKVRDMKQSTAISLSKAGLSKEFSRLMDLIK